MTLVFMLLALFFSLMGVFCAWMQWKIARQREQIAAIEREDPLIGERKRLVREAMLELEEADWIAGLRDKPTHVFERENREREAKWKQERWAQKKLEERWIERPRYQAEYHSGPLTLPTPEFRVPEFGTLSADDIQRMSMQDYAKQREELLYAARQLKETAERTGLWRSGPGRLRGQP